jgi:hypothetical protein
MQLEFNLEEVEYLKDLLEQAHMDLRDEIHRTDDFKFKQELREREKTIESVLGKLLYKGIAASA